jgi:hypothetical protein
MCKKRHEKIVFIKGDVFDCVVWCTSLAVSVIGSCMVNGSHKSKTQAQAQIKAASWHNQNTNKRNTET